MSGQESRRSLADRARDLGWELKSIADEGAHAANVVRERARCDARGRADWRRTRRCRLSRQPGSSGRTTRRRPRISDSRSGAESFPLPASRLMARRSFSALPGMHGHMNCSPRSAARNRARWDWRTAESSRCRRRGNGGPSGTQSFFEGMGTLARASLAGGLPREVLERVTRPTGVRTAPSPW